MLTTFEETVSEPMNLTKELLKDLPSEDEADVDYNHESIEEDLEDDEVEDLENEEDIDEQEVSDILMGSVSMQNQKILRGGKAMFEGHRNSTIMQDFESDEEDEEYEDVEEDDEESEEDDDEESEEMEEDQEISHEEVKDTFFNSAEVVGAKDTLLMNSSKVLRDGKEVSSGLELDNLTDKIKQMMQQNAMDNELL